MKRKKLRLAAAIAGAIVLLVATISAYRHPYFRRRRVEAKIRDYRRAPDTAKARQMYADPTVKAIWGRTLEIPVTFAAAGPPAGQSRAAAIGNSLGREPVEQRPRHAPEPRRGD